jgi:DNA polymerase-3 subunit epsilon
MSTETVVGWETIPITVDGEALPLTLRDVVERHDGAFWFERERVRHESFFRFLLPIAGAGEQLEAAQVVRGASRPEYYDFDLFRTSEQTRELADRPLNELSFTVFDCETTGLDPSAGDEIIQIGATRIVNGKLRRHECFEQLVDPKRPISEASMPIHGIRPEMVAGQPTIEAVLPAFHAFAHDTVLVGHNAAFDMRFLQLKEAASGVVFDQPVLDTLLLSALVHPQQQSHGLEAIAERLGVPVLGRHTALGDAIVTAEVFLKLVPSARRTGIAHARPGARSGAEDVLRPRDVLSLVGASRLSFSPRAVSLVGRMTGALSPGPPWKSAILPRPLQRRSRTRADEKVGRVQHLQRLDLGRAQPLGLLPRREPVPAVRKLRQLHRRDRHRLADHLLPDEPHRLRRR